jgi:hypothetical protein
MSENPDDLDPERDPERDLERDLEGGFDRETDVELGEDLECGADEPDPFDVPKERRKELLEYPYVVGVGIGPKIVAGERTDQLAIIAFVEDKRDVPDDDRIPETIDGVLTDVQESGEFTTDDVDSPFDGSPARNDRHRPFVGGVSVGHPAINAGSSSGIFDRDGETVIVTNRHIAAEDDENPVGDPFLQPGPLHGGDEGEDSVGTVRSIGPWNEDGTNVLDSAYIDVDDDVEAIGGAVGIPDYGEGMSPDFSRRVVHPSRRTGVSAGPLIAVDVTARVNHGWATLDYEDLISYEPISTGGSSGTLNVHVDPETGTSHPIGLHFAGGDTRGLMCRWDTLQQWHGSVEPIESETPSSFSSHQPYFEVAMVDLRIQEDGSFTCVVANVGGADTKTITLTDEDGDVERTEEVSLDAGEHELITFDLHEITSTTRLTIESNDDHETADVGSLSDGEPPEEPDPPEEPAPDPSEGTYRDWGAGDPEERYTFGLPKPGRFGREREPEPEPDDDIRRIERAYAATLRLPNGDVRHIDDIFGVDPTREHTALSDWRLTVPAEDRLDKWLHAEMILTFDRRVIYRGQFEDLSYSSSELVASISGRGAGAPLDSGSYQVRYTNIEDWRAIRNTWEELTDFEAYVVRPPRSVAIDEFEAEGTPLEILQELHEDYGYRFVIDQREPDRATSFKAGTAPIRTASWETLDDSRSRSVTGYHNKVTVVGARREESAPEPDEPTPRFSATVQDDAEIARMAEQGFDEPIEWHESDRSLESDQACENRAETLLEELVESDERSGSVDVFPRLIDPGPFYTVNEWDDERVRGPYSLKFDGTAWVDLPEAGLDPLEESGSGAITLWLRPGLPADEIHDDATDSAGCVWGDRDALADRLCLEGYDDLEVTADGEAVHAAPDGVPDGEWVFVHVDWEYDESTNSTLLRAGHNGTVAETATIGGRITLPDDPAIGRNGSDYYVGYVDDLRYLGRPLDTEERRADRDQQGGYPWLAELGEPRGEDLVSRYAFNEFRSTRGGHTIYDLVGGHHGYNYGAEHAGEPRQLETLSYSESDGDASCTLNFERVPSIAADIESLRRRTTKLAKQL